jgi:hypothetical protein
LLYHAKGEDGYRMSENRVLRRTLGDKRKEVAGGWRKLRNEELRKFYISQNIIRVIKLRRMRLEGHIARMGEMINAMKYFGGKT